MNPERIFQSCIDLWAKTDPRKALMLPYQETSGIHLTQNPSKELNLKVKDCDTPYFLHSRRDPAAEAKKWFSKLKLNEASVLFVYGVGLGYAYDAAKDWLKENKSRSLVFVEDNLNVLYHLFHTEKGLEILQNKQTRLCFFKDVEALQEVLMMLQWEFLGREMKVSALDSYAKNKEESFTHVKHRVLHDASLKNSLVDEYMNYGAPFFKNFYTNLLSLPQSKLGNALQGKFKKVPAIICGAGPSLGKQIGVLKSLSDKALIFAGGSALNALQSAGITPHFGAAIDPNSSELDRLSSIDMPNLPMFYRNRLMTKVLDIIKGPRLYITGSGGYDVSEWFENSLKIPREPHLDEGHNVVNFLVEVANMLGCSPIIFVGLDLAYTDMCYYAPGVIIENVVKKKDIVKHKDPDLRGFLKEDIHGNPVYTMCKWVAESEWIADFAKKHPKAKLINATEGGLGFAGIENISLKKAKKDYLGRPFELDGRVAKAIEKCEMKGVTPRKVVKLLKEFQTSMQTAIADIQVLLEELEATRDDLKKAVEVTNDFNLLSGRATIFELDLVEQPAYKYVLGVFDEVFMRRCNHEIQELRVIKGSAKKNHLKRLELNVNRLSFLRIVAEVNNELMRRALEGEVVG